MSELMECLLLLDDDEVFSQILQRQLTPYYEKVVTAVTLDEARQCMREQKFSHALIDMSLQDATGLSLIEELRLEHEPIRVVVLTGYASIATTVQAMRLGACNYLEKPASLSQIVQVLSDAEEMAVTVEGESSFETMSLKRREWEHIQRSLSENDGNVSATARALGMHRRTLQRKLARKPYKDTVQPE